MNKKQIVISNNPKAISYFENLGYQVIAIDGGYVDVLEEARKRVHTNYHLLTHPLSGSVKPNETPFKSIAIKKESTLDYLSLELITNAMEVYNRLQNDLKTPLWTENILDDFMVIDLDLIKNALI